MCGIPRHVIVKRTLAKQVWCTRGTAKSDTKSNKGQSLIYNVPKVSYLNRNLPPQCKTAICEQQQDRKGLINTQTRSNRGEKRELEKLQGVSPWMVWVRSVCQTLRKFWRSCIFSVSNFGAIFARIYGERKKDSRRWGSATQEKSLERVCSKLYIFWRTCISLNRQLV